MLTEGQIQCMKEDMTIALVRILIEEQHYTTEEALNLVYNSITFRNLQNTATGYYYQSAGYLYDDLQKELELSEYEASLKDFRDMFSVMNTAKNEGFALGKEEGIAQGIALGKEEGIALGLLNSARLLLSSGMTKEQVVAVLKLTDDVAAQL